MAVMIDISHPVLIDGHYVSPPRNLRPLTIVGEGWAEAAFDNALPAPDRFFSDDVNRKAL